MSNDPNPPLPPEMGVIMKAMHTYLHDRTVGVLTVKVDGRPHELGSGTLVKVGQRYLIATAAHMIDGHSQEQIALIHTGKESSRKVPLLGFNCQGGLDSDEVDVAWIEVSAAEATGLGKTFVSLDRLGTMPNEDAGSCYLIGYPTDWLEGLEQMTIGARSMIYRTLVLDKTDWPQHAREEHDMFLSYSEDTSTVLDPTADVVFPAPRGVSGGGIWWGRLPTSLIWSPASVRLVGIDRSWHKGEAWARGTQVRHWLNLVARDFPDTESAVTKWKAALPVP